MSEEKVSIEEIEALRDIAGRVSSMRVPEKMWDTIIGVCDLALKGLDAKSREAELVEALKFFYDTFSACVREQAQEFPDMEISELFNCQKDDECNHCLIESAVVGARKILITPTPPSSSEDLDLSDKKTLKIYTTGFTAGLKHRPKSSREAELKVIKCSKKIDRLSYCHCEQHEGRVMQCPPCDLNDALKALSSKGEGK